MKNTHIDQQGATSKGASPLDPRDLALYLLCPQDGQRRVAGKPATTPAVYRSHAALELLPSIALSSGGTLSHFTETTYNASETNINKQLDDLTKSALV